MAVALTNEEINACVAERNPATKDYIFNHTMMRVKDPKKTLTFYSDVLGMRLLQKLDFDAMKFSLYFMGYENEEDIPKTNDEKVAWCFSRKALVEFTHNWGSENDDAVKYHTGNSDPKGYGHIAIAVPDLDAACERMEKLGVEFKKRPTDGSMRGIAFILDPDGYWIELLAPKRVLEKKK